MQPSPPSDVTEYLRNASGGDTGAAAKLFPLIETELKRLAGSFMRSERAAHTLQPTALVNEAYLRMVDQQKADYRSRTHFLAVSAKMMRRVLVDHDRAKRAQKRGGDWQRLTLQGVGETAEDLPVDMLDLEAALEQLGQLDPRQEQVVELRYFSGLTVEEVAAHLGISPKTVEKDWRMARAWLSRQLAR